MACNKKKNNPTVYHATLFSFPSILIGYIACSSLRGTILCDTLMYVVEGFLLLAHVD